MTATTTERCDRGLFSRVDIASLVFFRITVGAIVLCEVARYFVHGWIARYYIAPSFHFTYYGFGWVRPWPGEWMYVHFALLGVAAVGVMAGCYYRLAAFSMWGLFTYVFLLDQARYLNHFYLLSLLCFLLACVPAHHALSIDAWRVPAIRSETAPAWALWIVRFQVAVPYVFAAIAKLNADWLAGEPLGAWLHATGGRIPLLFAYGGIAFDFSIVPLMLWRRTRPFAFAAAVAFHATNAMTFQIGVFPPLMIGATAMFFEPDWPRRVWAALRGARATRAAAADPAVPNGGRRRLIVAAVVSYACVQIAVPLRHWFYPGDVNWTDEGHRFSWRMKLRDKNATVAFIVRDPGTGAQRLIDARKYLTDWQLEAMSSRPDMILQFAHHVAAAQPRAVAVTVVAWASLNGHPLVPLIDPDVDLASESRTLRPARWIIRTER
jgi:hypothetical protein